jgi:sugar phosphate permease
MGRQDSPGPPLQRPTWVRYQVLAAGCLLALLNYVHRVGFASAGTYLKSDLGLDTFDWGVVMNAFLVGYAVFEVPWGLLGDRLGARSILTLMALGWSVMTAALFLVVLLPMPAGAGFPWLPFLLLLALRFLFGVFQAGAFPALSRVTADWLPMQERATAQGGVWMFSRVGGAIAPFLVVALIDLTGTWELAMVLLAAVGVLWCLGFWPWFRNRPEEMSQVNEAERALIAAGRGARQVAHVPLTWLFRSRSVWALCLMYGCGAFSATFFITMLPAYLRDHRGLSPYEMQWLAGLPLAFGVAACLTGGLVSDGLIRRTGNRKWARRVTGIIGHAGAGLAILATTWVYDPWALAALLTLTFFCNDLAMGPAWACCADIGERYAGTLGGTMNMVGNCGAFLGVLVAGSLFGKEFVLQIREASGILDEFLIMGNELVFVIFACSFWVASLCWLGVDVTRPLSAVIQGAPAEVGNEEGRTGQRQ